MKSRPTVEHISAEELPGLLTRLRDEQVTEFLLSGFGNHIDQWPPDSFPPEFLGLRAYELTDNLPGLPRELFELDKLKLLGLWDLGLGDEDVVAIASHFGELTLLDLWSNSVGDSGAEAIASQLRELTALDLENNRLTLTGVKAIAECLRELTFLNLGNNAVGDMGAYLISEHLGELTTLYLRQSDLTGDGARSIADRLSNISRLILAENDLGDDDVAALAGNLNKLEELDLKSNPRITSVAPLASLPLSELRLAETQISDLSPLRSKILAKLPVYWQSFGDGPGIYVEDCPLTRPSVEVVRQGPKAVRNYFREIKSQGVDQLYEAKLLIVGEGGAGKTSLLRRMFVPELDLPTEDETTRGIDIYRHDFAVSDDRSFRLNTWDFGGQQIYHATHQFFLTKRSLYVLVDDTRSDQQSIHDEGFKFWLEVIETLSEGSPLLIFQNEKGGRSKQLDVDGIRGRFPNLKDILKGNLEHPGTADELRQAVEYFAQKLPHIGEDVPAKWVVIRRDLEELAQKRPYISLDKYLEVYSRHLELDKTKAMHLSQYLHDLGVFLHFQQPPELRRTVFLQNQWVTEAVFRVLDDEQVKSQRGRFTLEDCDRLWVQPAYGVEELGGQSPGQKSFANKDVELRALMERFELCYRLPDQAEETWLVPQHLPPSKPAELKDWAETGDLVLTYRYEFLPRGLASRLMVRMHRFVKRPDLSWSHGALFEHGETQVLVETTRSDEIALRSRGPEQKALLSVIASDLDALNASFQGLKDKVGKWVPCICDTCVDLKEPRLFAMTELIDRKRRRKATIECSEPPYYHDVSVLELLDGMRLEVWLEQMGKDLSPDAKQPAAADFAQVKPAAAEQVADIKTVRIFLASSAELRDDRDAFELYFLRQNERLLKEGFQLKIVRWEDSLGAMSSTRSQDEYNREIQRCDVFVSLFKTKTGKYTEEEFDVARSAFLDTGKPQIFTYFRNAKVSTDGSNRKDLMSLWAFQEKLDELGHFRTKYDSTSDLQKQFRDQLDKLRDKDLLS